MQEDDPRAAKIYETIGTYFGYAIANYTDFYTIEHLMVLGRVTTGKGGEIIIDKAKEVLKAEFPDLFETIQFHIPDEKMKRHGQAVAAASLPKT
jgi:predicted NBD/HSP70 family sugar kinase